MRDTRTLTRTRPGPTQPGHRRPGLTPSRDPAPHSQRTICGAGGGQLALLSSGPACSECEAPCPDCDTLHTQEPVHRPPPSSGGRFAFSSCYSRVTPPFPPFLTRSFSTWACHSPPGPFFPLLSPAPGSGASFMCRWRSVPEPEGGLSRGDKCVSSHGGPGQCIARTLKGRWGICLMTDPRVSLR